MFHESHLTGLQARTVREFRRISSVLEHPTCSDILITRSTGSATIRGMSQKINTAQVSSQTETTARAR